MMRAFVPVVLALTLAACGGGGGGSQQRPILPDFPDGSGEIVGEQRGLVFTYPLPGQTEVAPGAPIVLRFSHPLRDPDPVRTAELLAIREVVNGQLSGAPVPFALTVIPASEPLLAGNSLRLQPLQPLKEKSTYRVVAIDAIPLTTGDVSLQPVGVPPLQFSTRAAMQGPALSQSLSALNDFRVTSLLPAADTFPLTELNGGFPLVDFSTLRLQFTQPLDAATVVYGESVRLLKIGMFSDSLVPAQVLVSANRLSIDPDADLDPTSRYRLELRSITQQGTVPAAVIRSRLSSTTSQGAALAFGPYSSFEFQPRDSGNDTRVRITLPSGVSSSLTGDIINAIPVASPLVGNASNSRPAVAPAQGELFADLAFAPNFRDFTPTIVPIRVPKSNKLTSVGLDVFIGGEVNANLSTEQLSITLISDANGLLLPNRFNRSPSAPSLVTLAMDISLTAKNKTSNGAFTQEVLHVVVSGIAFIDEKREILKIEAIGVAELKVLGVDDAVGVLSLKLETNLDGPQGSLFDDGLAPVVDSWVPGEVRGAADQEPGSLLRPGDPIIVNFSEPVDRRTLRDGILTTPISLSCTGCVSAGDVPFDYELDGNSLIIRLRAGLEMGGSYTLTLTDDITDLTGKPLRPTPTTQGDWVRSFSLPASVNSGIINRPPIVLALTPGYPCPIEPGTRDIAANIQGRCAGGQAADDLLPLPDIDPRLPISVQFSQDIDPATVTLATSCGGAGSFRVEVINSAGQCLAPVAGRFVNVGLRGLQFYPTSPWVKDVLYRYVLRSNGSNTSAACVAGSLCSIARNGIPALPLQTQMIATSLSAIPNRQRGGPDIDVIFRGGDPVFGTALGLRVLPILDVNANFALDRLEGRAIRIDASGRPLVPTQFCEPGEAHENLVPAATPGRCFAPNGALLQPDTVVDADVPGDDGRSFTGAATDLGLGCENGRQSEDTPGSSVPVCQGNQFLQISSALSATLGKAEDLLPDSPGLEIPVYINPSLVVTSGVQIYAGLGVTPTASPLTAALCSLPLAGALCSGAEIVTGLVNGVLPLSIADRVYNLSEGQVYTGPLVFRMRFADADNDGRRNDPILGIIRNVGGKLVLTAKFDLYTDIPEIDPVATVLGLPLIPIEHLVRSNNNLSSDTDPMQGSGVFEAEGVVEFLPDGRLTVNLSNRKPLRLTANLKALGGLLGGSLRVRVPALRFSLDASLAPLKH